MRTVLAEGFSHETLDPVALHGRFRNFLRNREAEASGGTRAAGGDDRKAWVATSASGPEYAGKLLRLQQALGPREGQGRDGVDGPLPGRPVRSRNVRLRGGRGPWRAGGTAPADHPWSPCGHGIRGSVSVADCSVDRCVSSYCFRPRRGRWLLSPSPAKKTGNRTCGVAGCQPDSTAARQATGLWITPARQDRLQSLPGSNERRTQRGGRLAPMS